MGTIKFVKLSASSVTKVKGYESSGVWWHIQFPWHLDPGSNLLSLKINKSNLELLVRIAQQKHHQHRTHAMNEKQLHRSDPVFDTDAAATGFGLAKFVPLSSLLERII